MYRKQIEEINERLKFTDKAIIAIGCSFVQGQGAVNDELYVNYEWKIPQMGMPLAISTTPEEQKELLKKYPNITKRDDEVLDFTFMEYDNAFVNVLCTKYFNNEYVPINLGIRGCGNRASIKELYFNPEIHWDKIKEIIVIYCPSGLERFDFCNDTWDDHFRWKAMWPNYKEMEPGSRKLLWEGYAKTLWSEKFEVVEQLSHVQELMSWCKHKNAKLIVTPGFDRRYNKKYFEDGLQSRVNRMPGTDELLESNVPFFGKPPHGHLVDLFPWDNMFAPDGHATFIDLMIAEEKLDPNTEYFFNFFGKGSPNNWITICSHPSAKGHDLFAKKLFEHIQQGVNK